MEYRNMNYTKYKQILHFLNECTLWIEKVCQKWHTLHQELSIFYIFFYMKNYQFPIIFQVNVEL